MRLRRFLPIALLVALSVATACTTTNPEDDDAPVVAAQPPPPPPPTDPRVSELQVLVAELLDRIEVLNARLARLEGAAAQPPVTQTVVKSQTKPAVVPGNVGDRYREALELFGKGRIDAARALFQQIHAADPNGELADNALYWIGETYYVTGKYNEALKHYMRVETDYGDQNKAPDAMLKIGLAYVKLGDLMLAKKAFNDLIAKHPFSVPAASAKAELNRIKY
jgi:tol-pal system protein YbgF